MNEQHRLALPQGTRIREFEFHRVLGYGGFGITYLGWNLSLDIPVAIKEYLPVDLATREQDGSVVSQTAQAAADFQWGLERFVDEARTLARFQHPNIVGVHQYFEAHSTAYIVMDYVEGEDLSAHLERKGTLQEAELKAILYPLLSALDVIHQADFLHRDIKPGNIVLRDTDGSPVLLDFGAARQAVGAKSRSVTSIVTPGYAPIEQYSSQGHQGPWTDIYALGGVCYRALTGQAPEDATDRMRHDPLVPVAQQCAGRASQEFLSAVDWALSVDEGDRPQSVGAWREVIEGETGLKAGKDMDAVRGGPLLEAISEVTEGPQDRRLANIPDVGRLNRWYSWSVIFFVLNIIIEFRVTMNLESGHFQDFDTTVLGVMAIGVGIIGTYFELRILHKLWSLIPAHKARTTPGKAVGFLLIPLFHLYWVFIAIHSLARVLNAETCRKSVSEGTSIICCILFIGLYLVGAQEPQDIAEIYMSSLYTFGATAIYLIMLRQMKNAGRLILQGDKA